MKYNFNFGTSDFKKLIENNNFFVDKSLFIKEVINESSDVLLIPRPRRFGKSLNFSMLRYFFDIFLIDHGDMIHKRSALFGSFVEKILLC